MAFKIRSTINGETVWFQGVLIESRSKTLNFAWTTVPEQACSFGLKEAATATCLAVGVGDVVPT